MEGSHRCQGIFADPLERLFRIAFAPSDIHLRDMQIVGDLVVGLDEASSGKSERSQR
jgi:hypothetical protein